MVETSPRKGAEQKGAVDVFVNFKELVTNMDSLPTPADAAAERAFVEALVAETTKVNAFYEAREREFVATFEKDVRPLIMEAVQKMPSPHPVDPKADIFWIIEMLNTAPPPPPGFSAPQYHAQWPSV
eukprot:Tamp_35219.p2 GENE.Tamp_35219~~Tamp_35219.p2  ORF type:complete len:127 (+),score=30.04 Tamp_35219:124-504(+)